MPGAVHPNAVVSGRYRIERELGRGGMAVVFLATDLKHGREVALKVLPALAMSGSSAGRFFDEIRTAAGLKHPNILAVYDSGELTGSLYYVTPYVEGETLRDRLNRQKRLRPEEAVGIALQLARALAHAHEKGVIHRDIKPENVLLDGRDNAYLADFGIARSLSQDIRRTVEGASPGSPLYMSPEQISGAEIDGRSDQYSLSCVLFEMLAGEPPFEAPHAAGVFLRHLGEEPPSLRRRRADVAGHLDRVVRRAMAKRPDDRYATADQFAEALAGIEPPRSGRRARTFRAASAIKGAISAKWVVGLSVGAVLSYVAATELSERLLASGASEVQRYAVFVDGVSLGADADALESRLATALAHWDGFEPFGADASGTGAVARSSTQMARLARRLDAVGYLSISASRLGDSVRVTAELSPVPEEGGTARGRATLVPSSAGADVAAAALVDELLMADVGGTLSPRQSTRSIAAARLFVRAQRALHAWDLGTAKILLDQSLEADPYFTQGALWRAQVGDWAGDEMADWSRYLRRGGFSRYPGNPSAGAYAAGTSAANPQLSPREQALYSGLAASAADELPRACEAYQRLTEMDDHDFAGWYGLGQCQANDRVLVRDERSPTGWSFRTSSHSAIGAYRRAFVELPGRFGGFPAGAAARFQEVLFTRADDFRVGYGGDTQGTLFLGWPVLREDTLAVVPYASDAAGPDPDAQAEALLHQRRIFYDAAQSWAREFPASPDALRTLAVALQMLGDRRALDTIVKARLLARGSRRLDLAAAEVWAHLRAGVPDSLDHVRQATALADSILEAMPEAAGTDAEVLAELSVLLGRPMLAARWAGLAASNGRITNATSSVTSSAARLRAIAAVGAPALELTSGAGEAESMIERTMPAGQQANARGSLIELAYILAFPALQLPRERAPSLRSPIARAQVWFTTGDRERARAEIESYRRDRGSLRPEDVSLDIVFPEAKLLAAMGDTLGALEWLEPTIRSLRWAQPGTIEDVSRIGGLVRGMILLADIEAARNDKRSAVRWASIVTELWRNGEGSVQGTVGRMRALTLHSDAAR